MTVQRATAYRIADSGDHCEDLHLRSTKTRKVNEGQWGNWTTPSYKEFWTFYKIAKLACQ